MQCGCPNCGTFMVQAMRGTESRCVCPNCLYECNDCMGSRFAVMIKKGEKLPDEIAERFENQTDDSE